MWNLAFIAAAIAAGYWFLRGQSIHKGFGFTLHWWAIADLLAGMLITSIAMAGIFLVQWAIGGMSVVSVQLDVAQLIKVAEGVFLTAQWEEVISRALQLSGAHVALALLLAFVMRGRLGGTWESRIDKTIVWAIWPAIIMTSLVFGYAHINNAGATYFTAFGNALGGLMYGIAFLGGKNIWLPIGMHFAWNFVQGPVLGFGVSGNQAESVITQKALGLDLLTGGGFGPEGGLIGMAFRFVVIALVLYYLYLRAGRRGNVAWLDFPIKVYANPPRPRQTPASDNQSTTVAGA
jgi:membrane protease YdiL (CAAX protease family)